MPRQARLDAPEILHHVMVRGIEHRSIFREDADRTDFLARLATLAEQGAWTIYALRVEVLGHPGWPLAEPLGVCPQAVYRVVGAEDARAVGSAVGDVTWRSWQRSISRSHLAMQKLLY
jgi:hypothetical protein